MIRWNASVIKVVVVYVDVISVSKCLKEVLAWGLQINSFSLLVIIIRNVI